MAPSYKVAVVQLSPVPLQIEQNYEQAAAYVRSAAEQGAQLVVLPEYHLISWVPHESQFRTLCARWRIYLDKYKELAKTCKICIVPGTIVELHDDSSDPEQDDVLLNVAYFIESDGTVAGRYVKKNLWGSTERLHLTSSARDPHPIFDTSLGKIGMLICWDLAFPEAFRELVIGGAKLIIIPAFWTSGDCSPAGLARNSNAETLFLDSMLTSRCFENTCAIVFCNVGGAESDGYIGVSQVTAPFVGPIARLGSAKEDMLVADLDMQIVEDAEDNYQVRADLAKDGWHYESNRVT